MKDKIVYSYSSGEEPKKYNPDIRQNNSNTIKIKIEKSNRSGKIVTIIYGLSGNEDLTKICSDIKKMCGTGGTVKNNQIEIQGDKKEFILNYLLKNGFKAKIV